ncbi:MAG: ABC transporter substrate-binding protein, partial [Candidatus Heimdallarchaeota archaeon]
ALRYELANYIKTALKPLGIDINLKIVRYNEWTDIIENGAGDYDMAIAQYFYNEAPEIHPFIIFPQNGWDIIWSIAGGNLDQFYADLGVSKDDLVEMLENINDNSDIEKMRTDFLDFDDIYGKNVMAEVPLVKAYSISTLRDSLLNFNADFGTFRSILLGMRWEDTNKSHLQLGGRALFDDWQSLGTYNPYDSSNLVLIDDQLGVHPDLAIQWEKSDWIMSDGTIAKNGKNTFVIREDAYWRLASPTESGSFPSNTYKIVPEDFKFAFDLASSGRGGGDYDGVFSRYEKAEVNNTENSITFFKRNPSIANIYELSNLRPIPEFLFNSTLYYNETLSGTPQELFDAGIDSLDDVPLFKEQWNIDYDTLISSGPYTIGEDCYELGLGNRYDGFRAGCDMYVARDDYYFPNEWDSPNGDFIVHEPGIEAPVFNKYNSTEEFPMQKPTKLFIKNIDTDWSYAYDITEIAERALNGELDISMFGVGAFGGVSASTIKEIMSMNGYKSQQTISVRGFESGGSAQTLFFNLNNTYLSQLNVRKAIAKAIDKEFLVKAYGGLVAPQDSLIWRGSPWYTPNVNYQEDYLAARDLMRETVNPVTGDFYWAAEDNIQPGLFNVDLPPIDITKGDIGSNMILVYMAVTFVGIKKLRSRNMKK